jgi:hypothetical protein
MKIMPPARSPDRLDCREQGALGHQAGANNGLKASHPTD